MESRPRPVGLVLAGGGARGAYEAGALSVLLPELEPDERPSVLTGTSVGAVNTAYLAANAHQPAAELAAGGVALWRALRYRQVLAPLVSRGEAVRLAGYVGEVLGLPRAQASSILDPGPFASALPERIAFEQIHENVTSGKLVAAGVVATSARTSTSVVFHDGDCEPPRDQRRAIEYVNGPLNADHVRASAAIPLLFPAVQIGNGGGGDWYFDGGTRLNTPIKPALELGAERVIVIALNSLAPRTSPRPERRPDALDGATALLQAVLVDPLVNDVHTLATINELLDAETATEVAANEERTGRWRVPYMLIAPPDPDEIGRIATEVYRTHYGKPHELLRSFDLAGIGHLVSANRGASHGELLSYLFFAPEFVERLIELGRRDARRWLDAPHDEGRWQVGPLA